MENLTKKISIYNAFKDFFILKLSNSRDDNELVYIKTIVGKNEEVIKIDISYDNTNTDYFNIPKDYTEE